MTEKKEFKGLWFIPKEPTKKVAGTLYFFPNETIKLELIGSLSAEDPISQNNFPVIQGEAYDVSKNEIKFSVITLFSCRATPSNLAHFDVFPLTFYRCSYILFGKHLASKEDAVFNKIRICLPYLNNWCQTGQWQLKYSDNGDIAIKNYEFFCRNYQINSNSCLSFRAKHLPPSKNHDYEYNLHISSYIEIKNIQKSSFIDLLSQIGWFKDFYSFMAMTAIPFLKISLFDNDVFYQDMEGNPLVDQVGEQWLYPIDLYFLPENIIEIREKDYSHSFLSIYRDIESDFETIIKNWYEKKEDSEPIIKHLIDSATFKRTFSSIDFLIVVQAIEGYYNRFIKEDNLTNIINNLYNKYCDIHKVALNKVNSDQVVDSRHYCSHFFKKNKKKNVCKGWELYQLTEQLKPLLICCVLSLIGIENNEINKLLSSYYQSNRNQFLK